MKYDLWVSSNHKKPNYSFIIIVALSLSYKFWQKKTEKRERVFLYSISVIVWLYTFDAAGYGGVFTKKIHEIRNFRCEKEGTNGNAYFHILTKIL